MKFISSFFITLMVNLILCLAIAFSQFLGGSISAYWVILGVPTLVVTFVLTIIFLNKIKKPYRIGVLIGGVISILFMVTFVEAVIERLLGIAIIH